ncbi:hypothetical protein CkaCkLH20_03161 [Colletotrichum karsti]|uniref:Uncharacterized protein n=1 Tax=Colletotrichum karsti TaxID=1095194 RepID=A0A9P6IB20_9PEZI|nr:uncharacterized protein CkaCkLH20_03161 [Colletotrichum karsti]KAF9879618.1 hypothetical protein CkaCkLH20_03161 [Colletotrichum karsti]
MAQLARTQMSPMAFALPTGDELPDHPAIDSENDDFSLTFTGPVVVGGPNVTLAGSAKSIYHQVVKLNPNYDADFSFNKSDAENSNTSTSTSSMSSLQPRDDHAIQRMADANDPDLGPQHGTFDCDIDDKVVHDAVSRCIEGFDYLQKLGNAACGAAPNSTARVSCSEKCGLFYHNLTPFHRDRPCIDVRNDLVRILRKCGNSVWLGESWDAKGRLTKPDGKDYVELRRDKC